MFPFLGVSTSVASSSLAFSTPLGKPLGKTSGFWGLGVCFGVEQGARIGTLEISFPEITGKFSPITVELFLLYLLVPLSDFLGMADSLYIFDVLGTCYFSDITSFDVGGVGLGVASP